MKDIYSSTTNREPGVLTLATLNKMIACIEKPKNYLKEIYHNCTDEEFQKIIDTQVKEKSMPISIISGIPVYKSKHMSEGDIMFINENGEVIEIFSLK